MTSSLYKCHHFYICFSMLTWVRQVVFEHKISSIIGSSYHFFSEDHYPKIKFYQYCLHLPWSSCSFRPQKYTGIFLPLHHFPNLLTKFLLLHHELLNIKVSGKLFYVVFFLIHYLLIQNKIKYLLN